VGLGLSELGWQIPVHGEVINALCLTVVHHMPFAAPVRPAFRYRNHDAPVQGKCDNTAALRNRRQFEGLQVIDLVGHDKAPVAQVNARVFGLELLASPTGALQSHSALKVGKLDIGRGYPREVE
jgi:hypothetical protein